MYTKSQVSYEHPGMGTDYCGKCAFFIANEARCRIVDGPINPADWCNKFQEGTQMNEFPKTATYAQVRANEPMSEHDTVRSRTTGQTVEIDMGMPGDGRVPKNPFASIAQQGYMHANPDVLGPKKLAEFDRASKGLKLPKKAAKRV